MDERLGFTDDQILAYLQGKLPQRQAEALEEAARTNPDLADHIKYLGSRLDMLA